MLDLQAIRHAVDPKAKASGDVRCPVHADKAASLSLNVNGDRLLVHCHAGCEQAAVFDAVRQAAGSLLNGQRFASGRPSETAYVYKSATGEPLARVQRRDLANGEKKIWQETPDGKGGWTTKGPQGKTPLYRLELLAARPAAPVVVTEGEKACEAAQRLLGDGYACTSWMGGADKVGRANLEPLRGREVIVWPDADEAGNKAAAALVASLSGIAARVRTVNVADLPAKYDAADVKWTEAEFLARVGEAKDATPRPKLLDLAALARTEPQPPRFIVEGWLPEGEATLFAGHGGSGKSLVGLTLAVCVAAGRNFYGLRCERRRVLFLSMEDGAEVLHWRLSRVCTMLGVDLAALAGWLFAFDAKADGEPLFIELRDGATPTAALQWLAGEVTRTQAEVLLLDNTSDAYAANENARAQVKAFVRQVLRIVPANGAVMLLHHLDAASAHGGSSKGYSGSTGWHNSCRARWYLRPAEDGEDADPSRVVIELRKSNHGKAGGMLALRFGEASGCFVSDGELPTTWLDRGLRDADERETLLRLIGEADKAGDAIPAAATGRRTSWHALAARPGFPPALKASRSRFWQSLEQLRAAGAIRAESVRKANRHVVEVLRVAGECA